jgi:hypothetical protein
MLEATLAAGEGLKDINLSVIEVVFFISSLHFLFRFLLFSLRSHKRAPI